MPIDRFNLMKMRYLLVLLILVVIIPGYGSCHKGESSVSVHRFDVLGDSDDSFRINFSVHNGAMYPISNVTISLQHNDQEIFNDTVNFAPNETKEFEVEGEFDDVYDNEYILLINNTAEEIMGISISGPGEVPYPYWLMALFLFLLVVIIIGVGYYYQKKKKE